jgi:cytochrome c-type biogenesis protein CcsB
MKNIEVILFWITLFAYVAAFCVLLLAFISRKEKLLKKCVSLLWLIFLLHTAVGILHWIGSKHPPVTDNFELNLTGTWFAVLILLIFIRLKKAEIIYALVLLPMVFILMGYGYLSGIKLDPMGSAFQSPWLVVHVIFAWLAFGFYTLATGAAIFLLWREKKPSLKLFEKLPEGEKLDTASYRFMVLGFINHAIMLVSGAIWAKKLWGHYWSWDPLETWSLIAFLSYAFYLHARSFLGWKMKKAAWLAVICLLILAISFWGVELFGPSPHPGP